MPAMMMGLCLAALLGVDEADAAERLPGSGLSIEEAVGRAQIVAVAKVDDLGESAPDPGGSGRYRGLRLKASRWLKGEPGHRDFTLVDLEFRTFPEGVAEAGLAKGSEYLFFLEQPGIDQGLATSYRGIKVLPATQENLSAVAEVQRREIRWPGSWRNLNDAAHDAQIAVVGKVVKRGQSYMGPTATTGYGPSRIEVVTLLKGEAREGLSPSFHVMGFPRELAERVPVPGDEYVIFIRTDHGVGPHILKMMPATAANIRLAKTRIKGLMTESPTGSPDSNLERPRANTAPK